MQRREFIKTTGLGILALSQFNAFADVFAQSYNFKPLRKNVGIFTEKGGTIAWLSNSEGIVTVDSQFPDSVKNLISELKNKSDRPFRYLINTHHHGDHTSGNIAFAGLAEQVVSHHNAAEHMRKQAEEKKSEAKQIFPDKTYRDDMDFRVGDEKVKLYYFGPGHTNGDAIIHFSNANIAHVGDLVFNRRFPFIDRPGGANINNWIKVLDKILKKFDAETMYVFGHAAETANVTGNAEDIKAFQNYLERLLQFVESEIKAGKSKEEILKATTIPGAPEWQGTGIERSLTAAYEELSAK